MSDNTKQQRLPNGCGEEITPRVVKYLKELSSVPVATDNPNACTRCNLEHNRTALISMACFIIKLRGNGTTVEMTDKEAIKELSRAVVERTDMGEKKYGERLRAFNGRDCALDLLQELVDALQYNEQAITESEKHYS